MFTKKFFKSQAAKIKDAFAVKKAAIVAGAHEVLDGTVAEIAHLSITVKNVLEQGNVKITAAYCPELDLKFNIKKPIKLEPGESAEITFSGKIPEESLKCVHFTVYYNADTKTPLNYQTRGFTVMNGEAAVGSGTQKVLQNGILDNTAHPFCILKKLGFFELVSMFLTVTVCRLSNLFH